MQVATSIKTRVESVWNYKALDAKTVMNCFQMLLSNFTCAATPWARRRPEKSGWPGFKTRSRTTWWVPQAFIICYDKVPKAINFRAPAQKIQLKILELKDAISRRQIDVASFNSRILSWIF